MSPVAKEWEPSRAKPSRGEARAEQGASGSETINEVFRGEKSDVR